MHLEKNLKICSFCGLSNQLFTEHHLIPKTEHNKKNKKLYSQQQLMNTVICCVICHNKLHSMFSEKLLAEQYNTIDKLINNTEFKEFLNWRIKHPNLKFSPSKQQKKR